MRALVKSVVIADPEKCVGCGYCEMACSLKNEGVFSKQLSRIRVVRLPLFIDVAVTCRLCEKPPCVRSCPRRALRQDERTGVIVVDESKCTGCGWCIEACDFGALMLHPERKVVVACNLCDGDPECVKYCQLEALEFTTLDKLAYKARESKVLAKMMEIYEERRALKS